MSEAPENRTLVREQSFASAFFASKKIDVEEPAAAAEKSASAAETETTSRTEAHPAATSDSSSTQPLRI